MIDESSKRLDKWLWSARIYKTRTLAGDACRGGKVKIDGQAVKPSRELKIGDIIAVHFQQYTKTIQVKQLLKNRVSAKQLDEVYKDLTPAEEYEHMQLMREFNYERRDRGVGRPTKKERRSIVKLKGDKTDV
ncbi:MAG: RNA-binding S4 domain-containing protein [Bacteroidetes bacterium]|nr:RNA-binding S4 domain-containing protein [Bacteroidota bacterium]